MEERFHLKDLPEQQDFVWAESDRRRTDVLTWTSCMIIICLWNKQVLVWSQKINNQITISFHLVRLTSASITFDPVLALVSTYWDWSSIKKKDMRSVNIKYFFFWKDIFSINYLGPFSRRGLDQHSCGRVFPTLCEDRISCRTERPGCWYCRANRGSTASIVTRWGTIAH